MSVLHRKYLCQRANLSSAVSECTEIGVSQKYKSYCLVSEPRVRKMKPARFPRKFVFFTTLLAVMMCWIVELCQSRGNQDFKSKAWLTFIFNICIDIMTFITLLLHATCEF